MGANFEIEIASRNYIPLRGFDKIWNAVGSGIRFDELMISPDGCFDRMAPFAEGDITPERAECILREGKLLYQTGLMDGTVRIGFIQAWENTWRYRSSLWFDTRHLPQYGLETRNPETERLRAAVDECVEKQDMLFYAMGVEMYLKESRSRSEMIGKSSGVLAWRFYNK